MAEQLITDFTLEMDEQLDKIAANVGVLNDIEAELSQLREDMDDVAYKGEDPAAYFFEFHRKTRILSELMHHTMQRLTKDQQSVHVVLNNGIKESITSSCK